VNDVLVLYLSRRNKGIMEPEYRLWLLAINLLLVPAALILWGVGAAHQVHWVGLLIAMGFLAFAVAGGVTVSVTYLIDSYPEVSSDAMSSMIIIRGTMSFAINYG
jgi:hypothetical protein